MTLDEAIERLQQYKGLYGGDTLLCIVKESTPSNKVDVLEPARIENIRVVDMTTNIDFPIFACLMNNNNTDIVYVW